MGKTKTALIGDAPVEEKSGKEAYEERMKKRKEKEAAATKIMAEKKEKSLRPDGPPTQRVRVPGLGGGQRVVAVDAGPIVEETTQTQEEETKKAQKKAKVRGKKYKEAYQKIDKSKNYSVADAIKLIRETNLTKFDATLELHLLVKKSGLSENVKLPYFKGKEKKIEIADDKTIEKLKKGKIDFDVLLSTPDMMPKLVPFAKFLGPKGLMPNPKTQTLIKSPKDAEKFSGSGLTVKTQKDAPVIHTVLGKLSQKDEELVENTKAMLDAIGAKQVVKAYLKSTMSPSVKLAI
jgi:large subunit ribosomal protein L1